MITVADIRKAICSRLRGTGIQYITGEDLSQSRDYEEAVNSGQGEDREILQVLIEPNGYTTQSAQLTVKSILVDVAYLCGINTKRSDIQRVLEQIDGLLRPVLSVEDRHFTIEGADSNITDNVGHYIFTSDSRMESLNMWKNLLRTIWSLNIRRYKGGFTSN